MGKAIIAIVIAFALVLGVIAISTVASDETGTETSVISEENIDSEKKLIIVTLEEEMGVTHKP
jgi:hypothetical protein